MTIQKIPIYVYGGTPVKKRDDLEIEALTNVPNVDSPILRLKVPDRRRWYVAPLPLFAKLYFTDGVEVDQAQRFTLRFTGSNGETATVGEFVYGPRAPLSWETQWTADHDDRTRYWRALTPLLSIGPNNPRRAIVDDHVAFRLDPGEILEIRLNAPAAIDWSNPDTKLWWQTFEEILG